MYGRLFHCLQAESQSLHGRLYAETARAQKGEQLTLSLRTQLTAEAEQAQKAEEMVATLERTLADEQANCDKLSIQNKELEGKQVFTPHVLLSGQ